MFDGETRFLPINGYIWAPKFFPFPYTGLKSQELTSRVWHLKSPPKPKQKSRNKFTIINKVHFGKTFNHRIHCEISQYYYQNPQKLIFIYSIPGKEP